MSSVLLNFKERLPNTDPILSLSNAPFMLKTVIGDLFSIKSYLQYLLLNCMLFAMKDICFDCIIFTKGVKMNW